MQLVHILGTQSSDESCRRVPTLTFYVYGKQSTDGCKIFSFLQNSDAQEALNMIKCFRKQIAVRTCITIHVIRLQNPPPHTAATIIGCKSHTHTHNIIKFPNQ